MMSKFLSILRGRLRRLSWPGPKRSWAWQDPLPAASFRGKVLWDSLEEIQRRKLQVWVNSPPRLQWAPPQAVELSRLEHLQVEYQRRLDLYRQRPPWVHPHRVPYPT